ncbi:ABC transporter permease [Acidipropionibacterium virtanenii]|uniref:Uncharacterized protein n=1 Tax=Acidipropionibacterium virtanenii TaxID=2057246 RepID=A0A344UWE8_9ACTN|nr:ABC transporter permease [Acidipropionibacterium virtanenii]AXE39596.1 hypothetical protein JS278_02458 [Acidipropionibacterium virtanenii]
MSTTVLSDQTPTSSARPAADQPAVPLARLVRAEGHKLTDTRSGFWLMLVMALGGILATGATAAGWHQVARAAGASWTAGGSLVPFAPMMLLPVLAILLVTSEWSTRSAMTTFTLEPRRGRVLLAKTVLMLAVTVVVWLVCQGLTALSAAAGERIHPDYPASWGIDRAAMAGDLGFTFLMVGMGLSLALLLGNAAAAIVVYMAQPLMTTTLGLIPGLRTPMEWASVNGMSLLSTGSLDGRDWAHVAVSATIWIVIPAAVGTVLSIRREIK